MVAKYFKGLHRHDVEPALHEWEKTDYSVEKFLEITPSAGKPQSEFIDLGDKPPAPLKATVKQAMLLKGIDPTDPIRRQFTTDIAKPFLTKLGYSFVKLNSYSSKAIEDLKRHKKYAKTLARPEQSAFRNNAISNFRGQCALSGCDSLAALEAAHIVPVSENGNDTDENALLLRADLHRLFDSGFLKINPKDGTAFFYQRPENTMTICMV